MGVPTRIVGRDGKTPAEVTPFGQLVVAPLAFSMPANARLTVDNVVVNLIEPKQGHVTVITDILLSTDKLAGGGGDVSAITIYEAATAEQVESLGTILEVEILKNVFVPISGLNLGVPQGRFVNITATLTDVSITILFYRAKGEMGI